VVVAAAGNICTVIVFIYTENSDLAVLLFFFSSFLPCCLPVRKEKADNSYCIYTPERRRTCPIGYVRTYPHTHVLRGGFFRCSGRRRRSTLCLPWKSTLGETSRWVQIDDSSSENNENHISLPPLKCPTTSLSIKVKFPTQATCLLPPCSSPGIKCSSAIHMQKAKKRLLSQNKKPN